MTDLKPPPSPVRSWEILMSNAWSWSWIPPVFPSSAKVRLADMDGWVSQGDQLLLVDGQVGLPSAFKPSQAVRIAIRDAGNITYLALCTDQLHPETHDPRDVTHYCLFPGQWPADAWTHRRWIALPQSEGRWRVCALIAQWAAWAHYSSGEKAAS